MRLTISLTHDADDLLYGPCTDIQTIVPDGETLDNIVEAFYGFLRAAGYEYVTDVSVCSKDKLWCYPRLEDEDLEEFDEE